MKIPFFRNYWDQKDVAMVTRVIKRGMYWANGPEISKFEKKIAQFLGRKYAVTFNSGTSALHLLLEVLDVKGREIIVPSFTFIATANAILLAGGKPIFADIEKETYGLDPQDVKRKITTKTKAILTVHYGGCSCRIDELKKIAQRQKLLLIEDAAGALGAKYQNKMVGSFGIASMFSFTPTKVISTGEGGIIVTNSKKIAEKLKLLRSHGRFETEDYFTSNKPVHYLSLGYNLRIPTICAAQGLAQLEKIHKLIKVRRKIAQYYNKKFARIKELTTPLFNQNYYHIYQLYSILINDGKKVRNKLLNYLKRKGITVKIYFEPIHKTYFYKNKLRYHQKLFNTEEVANKILSLPIYPELTKEDLDYLINEVINFFNVK